MSQRQGASLSSIVLLLILFTLLAVGSRQVSITTDEMFNVAQGYAFLARGEEAFWMFPLSGQPHLLEIMEAALPYLTNPDIAVERLAGWGVWLRPFVEDFAFQMFRVERAQMGWFRFDPPLNRPTATTYGVEQTEMVARMPMMFLTVLLGAIIFRWSKELWGPKTGLLALLTLTFDPTLLAHGRLSGTDVGTVVLGTAALYTTWRWMERPAWRWALGTGMLLGLTMLAKASGVLWAAAVGLIVIGNVAFRRKEGQCARLLLQGAAAGALSILLIWAGYGFTLGYVRDFPIPLPAPVHWEELLFQSLGANERWVFALGMCKHGRWWWYFPLAFLIKNPLPFLLSMVMGIVALFRRPLVPRRALTLGLFPILYTVVAIKWGMNIGYRHMLPIHPFLYLLVAAGLSSQVWAGTRWRRWLVVALSAWLAVETMWVFPNEIAYFNQLVGGTEGGYHYLADSNVEWGQSSHVLYAYAQAHPAVQIAPPASRFLPPPGEYVVNASQLQGTNISDPYAYEWFRHREPSTTLHDTLLVYDVPPHEVTWIAQCTIPAAPLDDTTIAEEIGLDDLRETGFDCTQSWLYPSGGAGMGIYALHYALVEEPGLCFPSFLRCSPSPDDPFVVRRLAQAHLSFEHEMAAQEFPAFLLYETPPTFVTPSVSTPFYAAPAETSPADLLDSAPMSGTASLDGRLAFLGVAVYPDEEGLDVETWWEVTTGPITRPVSIMAHLLTERGEVLDVGDGFGVPPLYLRTGDIFVQRHRFSSPVEGTVLWLRTGVYWLDTMERWSMTGTPSADAILVPLAERQG